MTTRRPTTVLAGTVVLLLAVLVLFAAALLHASSNDREQAERRFVDKTRVAAALTESLFSLTSSSPQSTQQMRERFGTKRIDPRQIERQRRAGQSSYLVVLDDNGIPIGFSPGTPPAILKRIAVKPQDVTDALAGRPYALSDYLDLPGAPGVLEFATSISTDYGRRVIVTGINAQVIGIFLAGYLARIPGAETANAYVLDAHGRVIGTPMKDLPPGARPKEAGLLPALASGQAFGKFDSAGSQHAFAMRTLANSHWRVVLSQSTSALYAGISSTVQWLILAVLALVGVASVFLLARALQAGAKLQDAFGALERSNAELAHSNLELKRSNAELEQFASVASHDLQEPLRKVQTFGDQLERRFGDQIPEDAVDYLRRMRRAANRMSTLIEDLLRFSRVTTHARPPQQVDLATIAREVTTDLDVQLQESEGEVRINGLPTVEADPLQMRQLLQNLIGNGLKFRRPGEAPVVELSSATAPDRDHVAFTVSDNGIGFEPEYEERIFRVFERLHPRDVYQGTGIGLALCRKIVERHAGTIVADGRPGEGARFTIILPRRQASTPGTAEFSLNPRDEARDHAHV